MTPFIVNMLAFLAVFLAVFAVNAVLADLRASERKKLRQRMEEQFREKHRERARSTPLTQDFSQIAADARAEREKTQNLREALRFLVEQSGLDISMQRLMTMTIVSGLALGGFAFLLFGGMLLPLLGVLMGGGCPLLYVQFRRHQRLERLRAQLPDAFDLMSRVLRSGQTISQAMQAVSDEFSRPIALEFLYCSEQMNLGLAPEAALRELARRTGLLEVKIFVLAVVVHRQTGGNLAELLDKLASVVRERFRLRGMIRSLTAQGRFQAGILLSLPPAMFALLMVLHYDYEVTLLQYPLMIAFALGMMAMGAIWVQKIVNFDF